MERAGKSAGERINERDLGLDSLRAWLVVLVVVFHATLGYTDFGVRLPLAIVPIVDAGLVQAVWLAQPQTWFATSVGVWLLLEGLGFVVTCAVTSFALLALSRRLAPRGSAIVRSFTSSSYGIYLLHYVFVMWAQYLLLGSAVSAWVKIVAVSVAAAGSSWLCSVLFRHPGLLLRRRLRAGVGVGAPGGA